MRLEGTWHGPRLDTSATAGQGQARSLDHPAPITRDLSWHGRTSHMRQLSEAEAQTGSQKANEHAAFLQFLEAAKQQRQEQRKVARLVLEGSTHGGVQYFLPARGTSSVPVPVGSAAAAADWREGDSESEVSSEEEDDAAPFGRASASSGEAQGAGGGGLWGGCRILVG
jgi:hypothetical protein